MNNYIEFQCNKCNNVENILIPSGFTKDYVLSEHFNHKCKCGVNMKPNIPAQCQHDYVDVTDDFGEYAKYICSKCGAHKWVDLFIRDKDYDDVKPYNL